MPANRHLGRSASQVAFRKARAEMAELYNKGYSPEETIKGVIGELMRWMPDVKATTLTDMAKAILFVTPRPGVPNLHDMRATRDFAACDMSEV